MDTNTATTSAPTRPLTDWLTAQPVGVRPEVIAEAAIDASVVSLGVNTRESHELFEFVAETTDLLIKHGFTTLAIQDNQRVADLFDRYITGADIDIDYALAQAWGAWQIAEMRQALVRLREHNRSRTGAPVRIIGIVEPRALLEDYDRIIELLAGIDEPTAATVEEFFTTIRVAHSGGEHVLRAHGTHPGTPFVELAQTAHDTAAGLPPSAERDAALELLDGVVAFHADAVGVGHDRAKEERIAADRILEHHRRTTERTVVWDGSTHIAAHPSEMFGAHLSAELGDKYVAVHTFFGQGDIERATIPAPKEGSLDAELAAADKELTVDLAAPMPSEAAEQLAQSWSMRIISGMYDPARDADHYFELPSVTESFDLLVYFPRITPAEPLTDA